MKAQRRGLVQTREVAVGTRLPRAAMCKHRTRHERAQPFGIL